MSTPKSSEPSLASFLLHLPWFFGVYQMGPHSTATPFHHHHLISERVLCLKPSKVPTQKKTLASLTSSAQEALYPGQEIPCGKNVERAKPAARRIVICVKSSRAEAQLWAPESELRQGFWSDGRNEEEERKKARPDQGFVLGRPSKSRTEQQGKIQLLQAFTTEGSMVGRKN